jgi:hypothetical protein
MSAEDDRAALWRIQQAQRAQAQRGRLARLQGSQAARELLRRNTDPVVLAALERDDGPGPLAPPSSP